MEGTRDERTQAFVRGIYDIRNESKKPDKKIEELREQIKQIFEGEATKDLSIQSMSILNDYKKQYLERLRKLEDAYRDGMEMATLHPNLSVEEIVSIKLNEQQIMSSQKQKEEPIGEQEDDDKRIIRTPKLDDKKKNFKLRYAAGAVALMLGVGGIVATLNNSSKQSSNQRFPTMPPTISTPTPKPTPVVTPTPAIATMAPIPTPTPTAVPNYKVQYNSLQEWYNQNMVDPEFQIIFAKYFMNFSDNKNMTIGELERCFQPEYFEGMKTEYEINIAKSFAVEKGSFYMEDFIRDLVKYKVMKAIGDPSISIDDLRTIYADNYTVNYMRTEMVRTKNDERYILKNSQLPQEIRYLINGDGIVQLASINESRELDSNYCNKVILVNSAYTTMKDAWGLAMEAINKEYRIQNGDYMREVRRITQAEVEER